MSVHFGPSTTNTRNQPNEAADRKQIFWKGQDHENEPDDPDLCVGNERTVRLGSYRRCRGNDGIERRARQNGFQRERGRAANLAPRKLTALARTRAPGRVEAGGWKPPATRGRMPGLT